MSFPQNSTQQNANTQITPDPQQVAANSQRLGSLSSLFGQYPGGSPISSIGGPQGSLAQTYNLSPAESAFQQSLLGGSLPGATLNRALGYTGPGGALGSLFQMNPQTQGLYNQGVQGYSQLLDPTGGPFQNYLKNIVGPMAVNNSIAGGFGAPSGATQQSLANAGTQAAMQYAGLFPQLASSGLNFAQTPQNMALGGLTNTGLPLAQQDYSNLFQGLQAAGIPRTLQQQGASQQLQLAYSILNSLPFQTGISQQGATQNQGFGNVLGSFVAPAAATGLGLTGGVLLQNLLNRKPLSDFGSSLSSFAAPTSTFGGGLSSIFGAGGGSSLASLGSQSVPEAGGASELLAMLGMG